MNCSRIFQPPLFFYCVKNLTYDRYGGQNPRHLTLVLGAVHKLCRLKIGNFWPPPPLLVPPWDDIVYGQPLLYTIFLIIYNQLTWIIKTPKIKVTLRYCNWLGLIGFYINSKTRSILYTLIGDVNFSKSDVRSWGR